MTNELFVVLSFALGFMFVLIIDVIMAFAAGVMVFVWVDELMPLAYEHDGMHYFAIGLIVGITSFMVLSTFF